MGRKIVTLPFVRSAMVPGSIYTYAVDQPTIDHSASLFAILSRDQRTMLRALATGHPRKWLRPYVRLNERQRVALDRLNAMGFCTKVDYVPGGYVVSDRGQAWRESRRI